MMIVLPAVLLSAQVGLEIPDRRVSGAAYGPAEPVELAQIELDGGSYQKRNVLTRGHLDPIPATRFYRLSDTGSQVLLLPMASMDAALHELQGRRVELTGIVRVLPAQQKRSLCGVESKCDDPDLPELPDARSDWPRVSITVLTAQDITDLPRKSRGGSETTLEDVLSNPAGSAGKTVSLLGLFRGGNLHGDLPAHTQRDPRDWVLKAGSSALWVTGKKPEGKGWRLDPAYKGDTVRWLEVTGRVEVASGVVYLRASSIALASRPAPPDEQP